MNRLADETSPYLRQHADNPVDWYAWGDDAFAAARLRDVPILLSVGYSACHWCHVMAHESFEDPAVAAVMNELFVNVKVDREERPDVDAVYMEAVQAMTGHGGWPMTVFLAPDGRPFFGGTYFPPTARHGLPGFVDLLRAVDDAWRTRREELLGQADQLTAELGRAALLTAGDDASLPGVDALQGAYTQLSASFDREWGGFGRAPKFPQTDNVELLLRSYAHNSSDTTLEMVTTTLDAMASGGMYDHVGGGFHRYSVDAFWMVPHFEKMLYDQAQLVRAYLHGWQVTGRNAWLQVVSETIGYVLRDLRDDAGGFYSAEDADSEGEEGRFYVWRIEELLDVAGDAAAAWYGATKSGNFEGRNILHRPVRGDLVRPPEVESARRRLFDAREQRVRPGLDDKVLTEWNALMISALAEAGAAAGRSEWIDAAESCASFLLSSLRRQSDGRWLRSWQSSGGARVLAYAADHAALVDAFTRLYEATGRARWIDAACDTADALLTLFWDAERGGVFTTGHDAERLVTRAKDVLDNATPSANSMAAVGLLRLAALTGRDDYRSRGDDVLRLLSAPLERHPSAFSHLLGAVDFVTSGAREIVVAGDRRDLVDVVQRAFTPGAVLAWGERWPSPLWDGRVDGNAYVCEHFACRAPVSTPGDLVSALSS
ncbi:MAG TPA: thioredoxin domain-containing protein [Acidimicrobiales bacterium]|nr:thioredoxin domain-containing protein [Acidimicrobiales bacterium]